MSYRWKYWLPVGLAFVGPIAAWLALSASYVCVGASTELLAEIKKSASCSEFWINRYQSILGNVLTAFVAGMTLYWVAGQLKTSNRQAAAGAAQALRLFALDMSEERDVASLLPDPATILRESSIAAVVELNTVREFLNRGVHGVERMRALALRSDRQQGEIWRVIEGFDQVNFLHKKAREVTGAYQQASMTLGSIKDRIRFDLAPQESRQYLEAALPEAETDFERLKPLSDAAMEDLTAAVARLASHYAFYRIAIDEEIALIWRQIRLFERHAVDLPT